MAGTLALLREVLTYEARRLVGDPRRRAGHVDSPPALVAASASPPAPDPPVDDWAVAVLDHAERRMAEGRVGFAVDGNQAMPFEGIDLGLLPDAIADLVRARNAVAERELVPLVVSELVTGPVPPNYQRLIGKLVWSAKGRGAIVLRDGRWLPGDTEGAVIPELEGRSLDSLALLAGELGERDTGEDTLFLAVLSELVDEGERAPRIVATVVGAGIALARRRGDLHFDRWGQARLDLEPDG